MHTSVIPFLPRLGFHGASALDHGFSVFNLLISITVLHCMSVILVVSRWGLWTVSSTSPSSLLSHFRAQNRGPLPTSTYRLLFSFPSSGSI